MPSQGLNLWDSMGLAANMARLSPLYPVWYTFVKVSRSSQMPSQHSFLNRLLAARHGSLPEYRSTLRPRLSDALTAWTHRRLGRCQVYPGERARGEARALLVAN